MNSMENVSTMLNEIYRKLDLKCVQLVNALFSGIFEIESAWYNGYYRKTDDSKYVMNYYPIPVISVKHYCDIEIDLENIRIVTKLKRKKALQFSFAEFNNYHFIAHSKAGCFYDFDNRKMSISDLHNIISKSDNNEIKFTFYFKFDADEKDIYKFVKLLRRKEFYY